MIGHNHEKLRLRSIQSSRCDVPVLPLLLFLFFGASHSWFHCGTAGMISAPIATALLQKFREINVISKEVNCKLI